MTATDDTEDTYPWVGISGVILTGITDPRALSATIYRFDPLICAVVYQPNHSHPFPKGANCP